MTRRFARWAFLLLWLFAKVSVAQPVSPTVSVRFELDLSGPKAAPPEGELVLTPRAGSAPEGTPRTVLVEAGVSLPPIELPAGSEWEVSSRLAGSWFAPLTFVARGQTERLKVWPFGRSHGTIATPRPTNVPRPKSLQLATLPPRVVLGQKDSPQGTFECPVADDDSWQCELPAIPLDLTLAVPGFIPETRWGVQIHPQKSADLGRFTLRQGASMSGWVVGREVALEPTKCRVRATPWVPRGDAALAEKATHRAREVTPNERGFFQIVGVPAGSYTVEASQAGASSARQGPLSVAAAGELALPEPLVLEPLLVLRFSVDPPLDPTDHPWQVQIDRALRFESPETETVFDGRADSEGHTTVPDQPRGRYQVAISDRAGQVLYREFDLKIESPLDAEKTFTVRWVEVHGRVTLGDEPIPATLTFGGKRGAMISRTVADSDGEYEAIVANTGPWLVWIENADPPLGVQISTVVHDNPDGPSRVDFEIPDTRVFGRVLDANERPVAEAIVFLGATRGEPQVRTSESDGGFEFRGVAAGVVALGAKGKGEQGEEILSEIQNLALVEGEPVGPIDLRLLAGKKAAGRVIFGGVGVPNASVFVLAWGPLAGGGGATYTVADGTFSRLVPSAAITAVAVVGAPGGVLTAFEFSLDRLAELPVSFQGGDVEVEWSERAAEDPPGQLAIFQNGIHLNLKALYDWTSSQGQIPEERSKRLYRAVNVAPGEYHACWLPRSFEVDAVRAGVPPAPPASGCVAGNLSAGATLRLRVPDGR